MAKEDINCKRGDTNCKRGDKNCKRGDYISKEEIQIVTIVQSLTT